MEKRILSGIYQIRNLINGKVYIGQSANLQKRRYGHFCLLRNDKHHNKHLQRAFNKYGEKNFVYEIVLICEKNKEALTYYEQSVSDFYRKQNFSYNIRECVDSNIGLPCSNEKKKKISDANKGKQIGENHHMYGKHWSEEVKNKNSTSHKGEKSFMYGKHWSEENKNKMSEGSAGKKKSIGVSSSKYVGVSFFPTRKNWRARITKNGKTILIGHFNLEEEAALAYNEVAIRLYGENARINIIEQEVDADGIQVLSSRDSDTTDLC